jgi:hypothetical protein|tara:strand:+ start:222 stop:551 length:330 start_codon:yes stop_codon:yes gene_type:complete
MISTSARKAKGRRLQNKVRELLIEKFDLHPDDIKTAVMGESGEDIRLAHSARKKFPFSVECKNQEKLNIWSSLEQAEDNANDYTPLLIFKRNRSKTYVTLSLEDFLDLL